MAKFKIGDTRALSGRACASMNSHHIVSSTSSKDLNKLASLQNRTRLSDNRTVLQISI